MDWGVEVANWVIALGTVSTSCFALRTLRNDGKKLRAEQLAELEKKRERRLRAERDHAECVTWWTDVAGAMANLPVRPFADAADIEYDPEYCTRIVLSNNSHDCLYEVSLQLPEPWGPVWLTRGDFVDDDEAQEYFKKYRWRQVGVLPPGLTCFVVPVPTEMSPTQASQHAADPAMNRYVAWVEFRDRHSVLWRRFGDGRLVKQADRPVNTTTAYHM